MPTPNSVARASARASGEMFYMGRACKRHPELAGRRRTASGDCHACIVERMRRTRKKKAARAVKRAGG
jgi:hypothetical protein